MDKHIFKRGDLVEIVDDGCLREDLHYTIGRTYVVHSIEGSGYFLKDFPREKYPDYIQVRPSHVTYSVEQKLKLL